MGFGQGLSGLNAASQNLDVIGNNIANSSTVGFKASTIAFADVYANSRVGLGVQVAEINQRFTTGNISTTGNQFDMAIDGAKGLFRLVDQSGATVYSRNGQFHADKDFNIVNAQGYRLTGFGVGADGQITNQLSPVKVPVGNIAPKATTEASIKANLDSREKVIAPGFAAKDVIRDENHSHSLPLTVYDSLGNPHQVTQYFVKTAGSGADATGKSKWDVYYRVDERDAVKGGSLTFDNAGRLEGTGVVNLTVNNIGTTPLPVGSPAAVLNMDFNYGGSTQFGGEFSPSFTQNGYPTGEYSSMSIAADGRIVANYTNGETMTMGAVALADFNNLNGLQPIGGNAWVETAASGQPVVGQPGTNGLAMLKGQAVEESNVDMSQELVNMIIAQRTYQANAQTIKTQDQILQTLITLR